jgi:hypothetical protein
MKISMILILQNICAPIALAASSTLEKGAAGKSRSELD